MVARKALPRSFYARASDVVARELLGKHLVSTIAGKRVSGRIVETEAYVGPHDDASHAAARIGRTRRNESMFARPGTAYVYKIYGMYWCLNAVTDEVDFPAAVLIRAVEPLEGLETMRKRRWPTGKTGPDRSIASGPGKLALAFAITGALDGHDLCKRPLFITEGENYTRAQVAIGPRIGITRAVDWPLRFYVKTSPFLSR